MIQEKESRQDPHSSPVRWNLTQFNKHALSNSNNSPSLYSSVSVLTAVPNFQVLYSPQPYGRGVIRAPFQHSGRKE